MSLLDQVTPSPRKIMTLFYVVDTSGSMSGDKIGSVNSAMEEAITVDLPDISTANDDAEIRAELELSGKTIGANDYFIAATARSKTGILVTHNVGEFSRVSNLEIEDWVK